MREKALHVLYQSDDNYAVPMCVSIYSLCKNKKTNQEVTFHLIDDNISSKKKNIINSVIENYDASVEWINGNQIREKLSSSKIKMHRNSYTTYMKLFVIDDIISRFPEIKKLLYLDSDTLVVGSLEELFNIEQGDACVSVVYEYTHLAYRTHLKLEKNSFNAGVFLVNIKEWVRFDVFNDIVNLLSDKDYVDNLWLHDQDVLNTIMKNKKQLLSPAYNMNHSFLFCHNSEKYAPMFGMADDFYLRNQIEDAIKNPIIIHYMDVAWTGMPWDRFNANQWSKMYNEYKEQCWPYGSTNTKKKRFIRKFGKSIMVLLYKMLPMSMKALLYYSVSKKITNSRIV